MWAISRARNRYSACSLRRPSRTTAVRWASEAMNSATAPITASTATKPRSTPPSPTMPLSIACCSRIGTTTRPVAPTAARPHVTPRPWRSTGASCKPRLIVWAAPKRPTGSSTAGCSPPPPPAA